jgi:hypothetical protein
MEESTVCLCVVCIRRANHSTEDRQLEILSSPVTKMYHVQNLAPYPLIECWSFDYFRPFFLSTVTLHCESDHHLETSPAPALFSTEGTASSKS